MASVKGHDDDDTWVLENQSDCSMEKGLQEGEEEWKLRHQLGSLCRRSGMKEHRHEQWALGMGVHTRDIYMVELKDLKWVGFGRIKEMESRQQLGFFHRKRVYFANSLRKRTHETSKMAGDTRGHSQYIHFRTCRV